jgi:hypothetical protein
MADGTYISKVYMKQGGDELVVASGGKITADGTQAAAITAPTGGTTADTEARAAITVIIAALKGVGITA